MDAQTVLEVARSKAQLPSGWYVWQLRRDVVRRAALGWVAAAIVGFALFIPALVLTVPGNYALGVAASIFTTLLLGLLAAIAFGGGSIAVYDIWRLLHASDFVLIMTPEDYVKATPRKTTHVPMEFVTNITLRGVRVPLAESPQVMARGMPAATVGRMFGTRQPRQPPSLAFEDMRTHREVVVATDDSFDALVALDEVLNLMVDARSRTSSRG